MKPAHKKHAHDNSVEDSLSKDYIPKSKLNGLPVPSGIDSNLKKSLDKAQKDIEKYKDQIIKKYKFVEAVGIIPGQASKIVEEEYEIDKEDADKGLIHVLTIIPEKHFKDIGTIRLEAINVAKKINGKLWIHVMTPVDIWNLGLDSKFEVMEALSVSHPVLDKGILSAMRVAQIHKSLVLRKFEKYVTSYVVAGSLTRGEAKKDSDVDIFIVIDDTDVKRMPRLELKEKLRSIIFTYIQEAQAMAGVKNILNVQPYLLTEFWDAVKDAHPVMFTFIRDGVPLYDRGAFLPWKSLLRMGKIKPSPEAIDMFMSSGNKLEDNINRRLLDIAVLDIYWSVLTPTQGVLMLYGLAPPTPKETLKQIREVIYEKEGLLEEKYVKIIEEIVQFYKDYEHGKHKKISGTALDDMAKKALEYFSRLKKLREEIDKRVQEKSIDETYDNVFGMLGSFLGKKSEATIIKAFDEKFVKEGKFPPRFLENLKSIAKIKKELSKKKSSDKKKALTARQGVEVDHARKHATEIINALVEYSQRVDLASYDKSHYVIRGRDSDAELFFLDDAFLVKGNSIEKVSGGKLVKSDAEILRKQIASSKGKPTRIDMGVLETLKKAFGDFELVY